MFVTKGKEIQRIGQHVIPSLPEPNRSLKKYEQEMSLPKPKAKMKESSQKGQQKNDYESTLRDLNK